MGLDALNEQHTPLMSDASSSETSARAAPDLGQVSPSAIKQLVASAFRAGKLKTRKPVSCVVELVLPILFVVLLAWLSTLVSDETVDGKLFVRANDTEIPSVRVRLQNATCLRVNSTMTLSAIDAVIDGIVPRCDSLPASSQGAFRCDGDFSRGLSPNLCWIDGPVYAMAAEFGGLEQPASIATVDEMMILFAVVKQVTGQSTNRFPSPGMRDALRMFGALYVTPDSSASRALVEALRQNATQIGFRFINTSMFGGYFATKDDAFSYLTSEAGSGKAWALLNVFAYGPKQLNVAISMNKSAVPWTNELRNRFQQGPGDGYKLYWGSGFLSLQQAIQTVFESATVSHVAMGAGSSILDIAAATPFAAAGEAAAISPMPYISYKRNLFLQLAAFLVPLALTLSFLSGVSQVAERLVQEKELRLREAMAAMGVSKTVLFFAWLIVFFGINLITATGVTITICLTFIKQSSPILIFVLFLFFAMSATTLGCLLSSLFSKSRTAAIATPILFFACSIPSFALNVETQAGAIRGLSILSPTAFSAALGTVLAYEQNNGIGWNDLFNPNDEIPIGQSLFMLIFDTVVYALLTWYLDHVLGGEWGVRQHPCFCFLACYKKHHSEIPNDEELGSSSGGPRSISGASEAYPAGNPAVTIAGVTKEFGSGDERKVAVNRMSLKIFPAMVTAILGHNGAGKTTLFNMLTGMLPISSGDCFVFGSSITNESVEARRNIGMCPQHNILWDDLTCYEHLVYFAAVKGVPSSKCGPAAEHMLEAVDLASKRNARSASLSGGQKRKLSVAIAFIGGSRLVLLDEPTAGMDVHTRRHTWDLIQRMAREEHRAIILTTHFMDEAELLGDRVAMMAAGQLHSYGSTTYLKSTLGQAYTLNVQYHAPPSADTKKALVKLVRDAGITGAREKEARGREQAVTLPMEDVERFAGMLRQLEATKTRERLGLSSFSMSAATIEDVFVAIAHAGDAPELAVSQGGAAVPVGGRYRDNTQHADGDDGHVKVTPQATIAAQLLSADSGDKNGPSSAHQFVGLMRKRFNNAKRDRRSLVLQIVLPLLCILLAMALATSGPPETPLVAINPKVFPDVQEAVIGGCSQLVFDAVNSEVVAVNATPGRTSLETAQYMQMTYNLHGGADRTIGFQCSDPTQRPQGTSSGTRTTILFSNSTAYRHAAPYSLLLWSIARLKAACAYLASQVPSATGVFMQFNSEPFPFTTREQAAVDGISNVLMALMIVIPFSFIPSTFTGFVVKERASKAKLLQFVSGVGYGVYWASNFLFDLIAFTISTVLAFVIFAAFGRDEYIGSGNAFGATLLLFVLYQLAAIPTSYVMSLPFTNHSTAQNAVLGIFFLSGFGLTLAGYLIEMLRGPVEVRYIFRLLPPAALGEGLIALANAPGKEQLGEKVSLLDFDNAGYPILYLCIVAVVMTLVILFVDHPERSKRQQMLSYSATKAAPPVLNEPADVAAERLATEGPTAGNGDEAYLRVVGLRKEFSAPAGSEQSTNVAVQNLTFKVPRGEIFGLLGTNGAGKTTTMNVITGECLPTTGKATVAGFDVVTDAGRARQVIGYCPQFDALHDLMTVDEHLQLYCALRGVKDVEHVSAALTTALGLAEYRRVKSKSLSGGNKRKLSVAIAMIGSPRLLLLDEPTAGMDPVARRAMCDVVSAVSQHCAVVLTTHHLEEVEALADRAAIMVSGKMQCLGTLEHLKATLGEGYQVSIRLTDESKAPAVAARLNASYACKLVEQHQSRLRFTVKHGTGTTLSGLFALLQEMKAAGPSLGVADYTVSQSSVEEVFLAVAAGKNPNDIADDDVASNRTLPVPVNREIDDFSDLGPPANPIDRRSTSASAERERPISDLL